MIMIIMMISIIIIVISIIMMISMTCSLHRRICIQADTCTRNPRRCRLSLIKIDDNDGSEETSGVIDDNDRNDDGDYNVDDETDNKDTSRSNP